MKKNNLFITRLRRWVLLENAIVSMAAGVCVGVVMVTLTLLPLLLLAAVALFYSIHTAPLIKEWWEIENLDGTAEAEAKEFIEFDDE